MVHYQKLSGKDITIVAYQRPGTRMIVEYTVDDTYDCISFEQSDFMQYLKSSGKLTDAEVKSKNLYFKNRYFGQVSVDILQYFRMLIDKHINDSIINL